MNHHRTKSQVFRDFIPGKKLGHGKYGYVKQALNVTNNTHVAIKIIDKSLVKSEDLSMMENEIYILETISKGHPNVITLHDHFTVGNELYLVMDLCTGGELFDQICEVGAFFEDDAQRIIRVLCSAVAYLHDNGIVHRDIKPENILLSSQGIDQGNIILADFGISKLVDVDEQGRGRMLQTQIGSPGYMAPEVIRGEKYGPAVDMWAVGVLTYLLLSGFMPFHDDAMFSEMQNACLGRYSFQPSETWSQISQTAQDFISKLLVVDPLKRLTAKQALEHEWIAHVPPTHEAAIEERKAHQELKLLSPLPIPKAPFVHDLTPEDIARMIDSGGRDTPLEANLAPMIRPRFTARANFRRAISNVRQAHRNRRSSMLDHLSKPLLVPPQPLEVLQRSITSNPLSPLPQSTESLKDDLEVNSDGYKSDTELSETSSRSGRRKSITLHLQRHRSEDGNGFVLAKKRMDAFLESPKIEPPSLGKPVD